MLLFLTFIGAFRWTEDKDRSLLREIRVVEPYNYMVGSKEAGQGWTEVANNLNYYEGFKEMPRDQRSVRERFNKLVGVQDQNEEGGASKWHCARSTHRK